MKPARAAAYLVGGILLAAWLASAAGVGRPSIPAVPDRAADAVQLDALASGVQAQASRLRQRMAAAPAPHAEIRNPFTFVAVQPRTPVSVRPTIAPPPMAIMLPEPNLLLLGVAEDGTTRTAIIESGDDLLMATEGQTVVGRYRVSTVGPDAIELIDLTTGTTRRLFLKSQALLL